MTPFPLGGRGKALVLGTSLWGSEVDRATAHTLLDRFLALGGGIVDTAPNYPTDGKPTSYQAAITYLAEWLKANRHSGLSVIVRIGATDNEGGPDALLNPGFIALSAEIFEGMLSGALGCLAVQQDNRTDPAAIAETVSGFKSLHEQGFGIGFSCIRCPDLYAAAAPELEATWLILSNEGPQSEQPLAGYRECFPHAPCFADSLAMAGLGETVDLRSATEVLRGMAMPEDMMRPFQRLLENDHHLVPQPSSNADLALTGTFFNPDLSGVIISPESTGQLDHMFRFWDELSQAGLTAGTGFRETMWKAARPR